MFTRIVLFLIINFSGLGIGSYFTGKGVSSDWYQNLNKAPWTPPGWIFGAIWTVIMICFAIYMAYAWKFIENTRIVIVLFSLQWMLNALWNPVFFYYQNIILSLVIIVTLTLLIGFFLINYWNDLANKSVLLLPYSIWLLIATSLNGYILFKN